MLLPYILSVVNLFLLTLISGLVLFSTLKLCKNTLFFLKCIIIATLCNISEKNLSMSLFKRLLFFAILVVVFGCSKEEDVPAVSSEPVSRTVVAYLSGDNSLSFDLVSNMQSMVAGAKSGFDGKLVVYFDSKNDVPQLFEINSGATAKLNLVKSYAEHNSSSPEVMSSVLSEIYALYPSKEYVLILSSHGTGWLPQNARYYQNVLNPQSLTYNSEPMLRQMVAPEFLESAPSTKWIGQDGQTMMSVSDLSRVLSGGPRIECLVFDACLMGSIEVLYELKDKVNNFIASPAEVLTMGFPYDYLVAPLFSSKIDYKLICDEILSFYNAKQGVSKSSTVAHVVSLELEPLFALSKEIIKNNGSLIDLVNKNLVQYYDRTNPHIFYDYAHYYKQFATEQQYARLEAQLALCIPYKTATEYFWGIPINNFSGVSTYIKSNQTSDIIDYYKTYKWSKIYE